MQQAALRVGFVLVAVTLAGRTGAEPPPNLLLLVAEDLSARVGAFGDPVAETPHLDALAAGGVRYPNVFTTAGVCAPSRAALVTGRHQIAIGGQHMRAGSRPEGGYRALPPPEVKAFPELLRAAGYHTFTSLKLDYQFSGVWPGSGPRTIWDAEDDAELWASAGSRPWFGMLNFGETHESGLFAPLGSWPQSLLHLGVQLIRAWQYGIPEPPSAALLAAVSVPAYYPDTPAVRSDLARHYQNVRQMDAAVGRILARLEADGLADSTVVVWTTDHGDGLPRAKRELYDAGLRVPMIVRWPEALRPAGAEPGGADERLVSFVDLAPTLLALAGAPFPDALPGLDFTGPERREYVFAARDRVDEVADRQRAVRDTRWKYVRSWHPEVPGGHPLAFRDHLAIAQELHARHAAGTLDAAQSRWFEPFGDERLFDTEADPEELEDLSGDPAHAETRARLRAALDAWLARTGDWSEQGEAEMVARFAREGAGEPTAAPSVAFERGRVTLTSGTEGASIDVSVDGGPWRLYTGPFDAEPGARVRAVAVRYGRDASAETSVTLEGAR